MNKKATSTSVIIVVVVVMIAVVVSDYVTPYERKPYTGIGLKSDYRCFMVVV